jgi:hypothetical protein
VDAQAGGAFLSVDEDVVGHGGLSVVTMREDPQG